MNDLEKANESAIPPVKCSRCPTIIKPGERYVSLNLTLEVPVPDGSIGVLERHALTQLCFGCASLLLTEVVVQKKMLRPLTLVESLIALRKRVEHRNSPPV